MHLSALLPLTAREQVANNLRKAAATHYKRGAVEAADTIQDVARIHKRTSRVIGADFKQTLQREKRFWAKAPEVWEGYKEAFRYEEANWEYTENATTGTWKLNNPKQVVAKWKAAW